MLESLEADSFTNMESTFQISHNKKYTMIKSTIVVLACCFCLLTKIDANCIDRSQPSKQGQCKQVCESGEERLNSDACMGRTVRFKIQNHITHTHI